MDRQYSLSPTVRKFWKSNRGTTSMKKDQLPTTILLSLIVGMGFVASENALAAAPAGDLKIAVFDQQAAGGQGASVKGLLKGLQTQGYDARQITDLQPITLCVFDIVYLSDMHSPGSVHKDWRKSLKGYVEAGGSVLQTWHHHIFREVGAGVQRIYGSRTMHVRPGHPAVEGMTDFQASFSDHIIERVGPKGTVLIENESGQPVAVAGKLGKGKVISTGLALAIPGGRGSAAPRGDDAKLLKEFLGWLSPDVPREERIETIIRTPQLCVSPAQCLVAAGFDAVFHVTAGYAGTSEIQLECEGATVEAENETPQDVATARATVRHFRITVPTAAKLNGQKEIVVRARLGSSVLEQTVDVNAVFAEPPEREVRGVWLHVRPDRHPKTVMPELKRLGINMTVLRIAGGTAAFYASKVQPDVQDPLAPDGDWLAEAVRYAHSNGIEMHPYVNNCVVEGRTSRESLARLRAAGRLQEGPDGKPIDWFCPSQEVNFEAMERPMIEIVSNYDVDGIQYDFIRYPNASGCFCAKCRQGFERETGNPVANWPDDCVDGSRHAEWVEYRCGRISSLVERISTRIREVNPKVKISAAVFRDWPDCRENNGQDWVRWCQQGWLDFVCPMNYTLDPVLFAERAAIHRKAVPKGFPIVQGIGIASGAGKMNSAEELAVQIMLARQAGAAGFVGFAYQPSHTSALFMPLTGAWDMR
jgi:uncharacterized lipoprotein YddW (UPF0748 family)